MPGSTLRGALPYPLGGDVPDTDGAIKALADRIALLLAIDEQGPIADRPLAGVRGRYYTALDQGDGGLTYRDTGSAWRLIGAPAPDLSAYATDAEVAAALAGKLGVNAKAADSELLDGQDSSIFETKAGASAAYVPKSLADAAGDLIKATGPAAFARMPIGTALQILRVNAAGTDLEYATSAAAQIATGTYTGDNTSPRTIALPFTPKFVWLSGPNSLHASAPPSGRRGLKATSSAAAAADTTISRPERQVPLLVTDGFQVGVWTTPAADDTNFTGLAYHYLAIG